MSAPRVSGAVPPALDVLTMTPDPAQAAFAWQVLALFAFDDTDWLFWRFTDGAMTLYVNCNDAFAWGCADAEQVTPDNLAALAQAKVDALATGSKTAYNWPLLFCARVRGMRLQGAMYKYIDETLRPLFDACGPAREVGFGNPVGHPDGAPPLVEGEKGEG